jgi:NAD(P)-dependent dehydrogenase (short-subunit alcohol dehydrogenase family)
MKALVTGAARGLGLATARRLAADGARVALLDRDPLVEEAAAALDPGCVAIVADLADDAVAVAGLGEATAALGGLDALVNCAGIGGPTTPVADTSVADLRRVLDVNLIAPFALCSAAVGPLREAEGPAAIVNIGSVLGVRGEPNGAPYCVSKAALRMFTEVLALELAPLGIRVNAVAPGAIETDMHFDHLREIAAEDGTTLEEELARVRAGIPIGRHGTPDDVAAAVAWLASPEAGYVTGQTILVDGGGMDR